MALEAMGAEVVLFPEVERRIEGGLERWTKVFGECVKGFRRTHVNPSDCGEGFAVQGVTDIGSRVAVRPEVGGTEIFEPQQTEVRKVRDDFRDADTTVGEEVSQLCVHRVLCSSGAIDAEDHPHEGMTDTEIGAIRSAFQEGFRSGTVHREGREMRTGEAKRLVWGAEDAHDRSVRSASWCCPLRVQPSVTMDRRSSV